MCVFEINMIFKKRKAITILHIPLALFDDLWYNTSAYYIQNSGKKVNKNASSDEPSRLTV